jgi:hypothetical protein
VPVLPRWLRPALPALSGETRQLHPETTNDLETRPAMWHTPSPYVLKWLNES